MEELRPLLPIMDMESEPKRTKQLKAIDVPPEFVLIGDTTVHERPLCL